MNVWSLIKDFVNKGELSKIATPVQFLEPLSELQQRCEDMEYSELLDQVLCGVAAFLTFLPYLPQSVLYMPKPAYSM
jgi:hypothetical protein